MHQNVPHVEENPAITFRTSAIYGFSAIGRNTAHFSHWRIMGLPQIHAFPHFFPQFLQFLNFVHVQLPQLVGFEKKLAFCSFPVFFYGNLKFLHWCVCGLCAISVYGESSQCILIGFLALHVFQPFVQVLQFQHLGDFNSLTSLWNLKSLCNINNLCKLTTLWNLTSLRILTSLCNITVCAI